jgi:hypothetical protein
MARYDNANKIINRVALEVGLTPVNDAFGDPDQNFQQLGGLLNSAGAELAALFDWEAQTKDFEIITTLGDTGYYELPTDYGAMIDQTGWDLINNVPVTGPLSEQQWSFLLGRNFVTNTIYPSFRLKGTGIEIYPFPPPEDSHYTFQYNTRSWVIGESDQGQPISDEILTGSDTVIYKPILIIKMLKMKWLQAKELDSSGAALEFDNILQGQLGKDKGAPRLNAGRGAYGLRYLDGFYNAPDSGYGGV